MNLFTKRATNGSEPAPAERQLVLAGGPAALLLAVLLAANLAAVAAAAIAFRCRSLENIPGLNGDEAWYGVQAWEVLHGGDYSLRTPTGNLLNPLMFIPLVLLHACFKPSVALLRMAPLVSGIAALAVNWTLCRRIFDRATAVIATLILVLLPINIAYSRFAWDASQSLLATLPVWLFSLMAVRFPARRDAALAAAIACLLPAILVHPTNIFAATAIAASMATGWRQWRLDRRRFAFLAVAAIARDRLGDMPGQNAPRRPLDRPPPPTRSAGGTPALRRALRKSFQRRDGLRVHCRVALLAAMAGVRKRRPDRRRRGLGLDDPRGLRLAAGGPPIIAPCVDCTTKVCHCWLVQQCRIADRRSTAGQASSGTRSAISTGRNSC